MADLVVVVNPWVGLGAGKKAEAYLRNCIRDCIARGELPWAAHCMFDLSRALYIEDAEQRTEGLYLQKMMILKSDKLAVYQDHKISLEMQQTILFARIHGKAVDNRYLYRINSAFPAAPKVHDRDGQDY